MGEGFLGNTAQKRGCLERWIFTGNKKKHRNDSDVEGLFNGALWENEQQIRCTLTVWYCPYPYNEEEEKNIPGVKKT